MPTTSRRASARRSAKTEPDVDALLAALEHPHLDEIHAVRALIRDTDPRIRESVKWNAPSFATTEHFATFHLRGKRGIQIVLHLGAKARPDTDLRTRIHDPSGLLDWRGPDRATITFADGEDLVAKQGAFVAIVRQWIAFV